MPKKQTEYFIHELAKRANVSVRTIRFYINEGLLPAPQTRGRYTVYTHEYLDRLELIRRLKESFLPLKEIRATLTALSWNEVRVTLADLRKREAGHKHSKTTGEKSETEHKVGEARSSALEYITDLLSSTPVNRPLPPQPAAPNIHAALAKSPGISQESWQRVTLAPGVELQIRLPIRPDDQPKIEAILRLAKNLFPS